MVLRAIVAVALVTGACYCLAQTAKAPTSNERKAILAALRAPVSKSLKGMKVTFKVDHLVQSGDWAFLVGQARNAQGQRIDYTKTPYAAAVRDGIFDDWVCGLLRKIKGKWTVVDWSLGATDVVWDGWDKRYRAPRAIFPYGR